MLGLGAWPSGLAKNPGKLGLFVYEVEARFRAGLSQKRRYKGCQIFYCTQYQNEENYTKLPQNITNGLKIYQLAVN
jgi:hypothetical protein